MDDNRIVELYLSRDESAIRETPAESLSASDSSFIHSKTPPCPRRRFVSHGGQDPTGLRSRR